MKIMQTEFRHAQLLSDYYQKNAARFQPWDPLPAADLHSVLSWQKRLRQRAVEQRSGHAVHFVGVDEGETFIYGACSLTNIVRGPFQACYLGYSVDTDFEGRRVMSDIVRQVIAHAFRELNLHRIMANHMPANTRSARLLDKLGFHQEGIARSYLKINGQWEDHVLNALINPDFIDR